jgi:hypothetical protein
VKYRLGLLVIPMLLTPYLMIRRAETRTHARALDECPRITLACPSAIVQHGEPLTFAARISGGTPSAQYSFSWTVSAGTIMSGQGTPTITVDSTGLWGQNIAATLEVGGFPEQCAKSESCVAAVSPRPREPHPLDRYGYLRFSDERARLDNFAIQLQQEPDAIGYIVTYAGKGVSPNEARHRARRAKRYVVKRRGIEAGRVVPVYGGRSDGYSTVLWTLPRDIEIRFGQPIK